MHPQPLFPPALGRCLFVLLLFLACRCLAHDTGSSYLKLAVETDRITGRWEIALHDFQETLKLDSNPDDAIGPEERQTGLSLLSGYALGRLRLTVDGVPRSVRITDRELKVESSSRGTNVVFNLEISNLPAPRFLEIDYRLFFEIKPQHRGLLLLEAAGRNQTAMFSPDRPVQCFELHLPKPGRQLLGFGREGVRHIWVGIDHILFLLALLLPAVLKHEHGTWLAVAGFRSAFFNVFKIVTAFTLAHSVTLSFAALELVRLPSRWVESAIAASVLVAALNNLRPFVRGRAWLVAFGFGLVHGFGFAGALIELALPRESLVPALIGFNLGVEAGQLAIVVVFLPVAYGLRASWFYQKLIVKFGSVGIAGMAMFWMLERLLGWNVAALIHY